MTKHFILILVLINFVSFNSFAQSSSPYSFFIAGHVYGKPGVDNQGVHPPFKEKFSYIQNRTEIQFGVFTGDIVKPSPIAQDWDEIDSDILDLGLPVYFAVGNHDMENRPLYESRYGVTYQTFIHENDLFIILDPNIDSWNISGDQLSFLENTLNQNAETVDNIFVLFHQLLWIESDNIYSNIHPNSFAGRADSINFWTVIEPIFHQLPNQVYFCTGDVGAASWSSDFMYDTYDNITFIASGMGEESGDNFIVLNINSDKSVSFDLICLDTQELECFGALEDFNLHTSREEITNLLQLNIFPNPCSDYIIIEGDNPLKDISFLLYDSTGKNILNTSVETGEKLYLNDLTGGIYFYKILTTKGYKSGKLVIKN